MAETLTMLAMGATRDLCRFRCKHGGGKSFASRAEQGGATAGRDHGHDLCPRRRPAARVTLAEANSVTKHGTYPMRPGT